VTTQYFKSSVPLSTQPYAVPKQFLNKFKNIIEEAVEPAPHRAKNSLRAKSEQRRSAKNRETSSRRFEADAATKKKEVFFGFLLILAGVLILGTENIGASLLGMMQSPPEQTSDLFGDNNPAQANTAMTPFFGAASPNTAASYFGALPGNPAMASLFGAAPPAPEISMLDASQFGPGLMQQMVPDAGSQSCPQFHSFAGRPNSFSQNIPAGAAGGYNLSNQAITGVAQQLQFSGPMMLRQGKSPIWKSSAPHAPISPNRLMQNPLMTNMMTQVHRSGYTRILHPTQQTSAQAAPPVAGALSHLNHLSSAMSALHVNAGSEHESDK